MIWSRTTLLRLVYCVEVYRWKYVIWEHGWSISSYCHRRKVCPGRLRSPVLSACDWILCSERKHKSAMLNHSRINTSAHICDVNRRRNVGIYVAACASSCVREFLRARSLCLCFCSSSLEYRFQSPRRHGVRRRFPRPPKLSGEHKRETVSTAC